MKIVYVENVRIPSERAHAYQIVQCAEWLGRFGHEVTLVNPDRADGKDVFEYFGLQDHAFVHATLPSRDLLSLPWPSFKPYAYALQRFTFVRSLRAWARQRNADIWYTRDPAMIDGLRGVVRGPWILEVHDAPDHVPARWERVKSSIRGFVAISVGLKQDLVERLGVPEQKIAVASDGYDPAEFTALPPQADVRRELGIPDHAFVALYAGGFYRWKGIDLVVRAWREAPEQAHLLLVGGPDVDRERLQTLVDPGVHDRVRILSMRPRREAVRLFAAADIGLLTSSPAHAIGRAFTSPLKQFEYMAAGLPILASDVPSSHEVLHPAFASFYGYDERAFLDKLRSVMEDAAWRASASARAREVVSGYSWEARARRIAEFIERII